jgi:two-component system sensor histidine kinase UhpB
VTLLRRIFVANAAIFALAAVALVVSPATVSFPVAAAEAAVVVVGLVAMLALNFVVLRRTLRPLACLTGVMGDVDLLRPGQRIAVEGGDAEVDQLAAAFNVMVARLERERHDSARRAVGAAEEERRRVARELHDEVGQTLTAVMLELDVVSRESSDRARLGAARESVRRALEEVRAIARALRPHALDDLGLASALRALAIDVSRTGSVKVERAIDSGVGPLSEEQELAIYRVGQEAMTNALRHAKAHSIVLALAAEGSQIVLRVRDDGHGFAPDAHTGGLGLRMMQERAVLAGGVLTLSSSPGQGTEVALRIALS